MRDKKAFGYYIKSKRIEKNLTQKDLADNLYVSESAVSKWERGVSYPDITLLSDICKILGVTEQELIKASDDAEYRKIKKDSIKYNKIKKVIFITLNICYLTALLTCFIVNLAVNHTLSWFFIVLTSLICAYSFCPTFTFIFKKFKKLTFAISTFFSLFLIFLTCSIYTNNYWFLIATSGVLLAYFIVFFPILFIDFKDIISYERYKKISKYFLLMYTLGIFILVVLMLISIYQYKQYNFILALMITTICFLIPILFGIVNLFKCSKQIFKFLCLSMVGVVIILTTYSFIRYINIKNSEDVKTYIIEEKYNDIKITTRKYDINIYPTLDNEDKIIYKFNKISNLDIQVYNNTLIITSSESSNIYDNIFQFYHLSIDLYLSETVINNLNIDSKTGDIDLNKNITFCDVDICNSTGDVDIEANIKNSLNIELSTGDVEMEKINVNGNIKIKCSTGNVDLIDTKCDNLDITISTGDIWLENVILTSNLRISGKTGDVIFADIDASNISIDVSTGDVEGTILTSKWFIVKTRTGDVLVPNTREGGVCEINTSTGNVFIRYS